MQLSSDGNRMTGEIERHRLQSEKNEQLHVSHLSVPSSKQLHAAPVRLTGPQNREQWFSSFYFRTL